MSAPTWAPSKKPDIARRGPGSAPGPIMIRSLRGASIGRMLLRLAAIHAGRSTASSGGSSAGAGRPLYAATRWAKS